MAIQPQSTPLGRVASPGSTGIRVIIVGCGFAGLSCAIECKRKGHEVLLLEKFAELKPLGDVLSLGPNAGRFIERWGLHDRLWPKCGHADVMHIHNHTGELLLSQPFPETEFGSRAYNGHRAEMHQILYDYAKSIAVEIRLGQRVTGYWECEENGRAGVVLADGERIEADVVVAADGVRSKARKLVLGHEDKPKSSGYAIYRAWYNAAENGILEDPLTDFMCKGRDVLYTWIGQDVHFITSCSQGGTAVSWVLTHRDDADIDESWSLPGKIEDVLEVVKDWDPRCRAVISKSPSCVDWKLVYRDPMPTWVSKGGRLLLMGDAAHPFLPTSIQGASQAMEDGITLAVTLELAGKSKVPLAVRTWEKLRYQRVRLAQLMGESTRDKWHQARPDDHRESLDLPRPEWLFAFDAERHAYDSYATTAKIIEENGYQLPVLP